MSAVDPTADLAMAFVAAGRDTTDRLIAVMREQIAAAEAHRKAVEHGVQDLLASDGFTDDALWSAVFCPPQVLIDRYRQETES